MVRYQPILALSAIILSIEVILITDSSHGSDVLITNGTSQETSHEPDVTTQTHYLAVSNKSHEWWESWGKPYLKPEIGIFLTPEQPVFIPAATWTHLFEVELPCLSSVLNISEAESWTLMVNQITQMLTNVGLNSSVKFNRIELEHMQYLNKIQTNIVNFLISIKDHISRIDTQEQYVYDYMEKICTPIDARMFRDHPESGGQLMRLKDYLSSGDIELRRDDTDDEINHGKTTLLDLEEPTLKAKLLRLFNENSNDYLSAFNNHLITHKDDMHRALEKLRKEMNITGPAITFAEGEDENRDESSRKRRSMPGTYANNVYNQYVNHANFTNIQGQAHSKQASDFFGGKQVPSDSPSASSTFTSQMIDLSDNKVMTQKVPTITNYSPRNPTKSPDNVQPQPAVSPDRMYRELNPKETVYEKLRRVLTSLQRPGLIVDREMAHKSTNVYYESILTDLDSISSVNPQPVEYDQYSVLTIKICTNWIRNDGNISTTCVERFAPTVKSWTPHCGGGTLGDSPYMNDSPMTAYATQLRDALLDIDMKFAKVKTVDNSQLYILPDGHPPRSRGRRGLGDGIMTGVWKPLFGAASEEDLQKVVKALEQSKSSSHKLFQNQKNMISVQKQQEQRLDKISMAIANITEIVHLSLSDSKSDLNKLLKETEQIKGSQIVAETLMAIGTLQNYVQNALTLLKFKLTEISDTYKTLHQMIRGRYIAPSFLSGATLEDLITGLRTFKSPKYIIPPTWARLSVMDDKSAGLMVKGRTLLMSLKIPLIMGTQQYSIYQAHSIPFRIGDKIMQTQLQSAYYIIDRTNAKWSTLNAHEYSACLKNPGQICPYSIPMHSLGNPDCFSSIVGVKDLQKPNKLCKIDFLGDDKTYQFPVQNFSGQIISDNQWVLSALGKQGVVAYETCDDLSDDTAVQTATRTLVGINVIQVSEGCRVQIGDSTFSTSTNWRTTAHRTIQFNNQLLIDTSGLGDLKIWKMSSLIDESLRNATIFSFPTNKVAGKKSYLFKNGVTDLDSILKLLQSPNASSPDIGLLSPDDIEIPDFEFTKPNHWNFSHWQLWSVILGSFPILMIIAGVAYLVFRVICIKPSLGGAVAFSALPTSFTRAHEIGGVTMNNTKLSDTLNLLLKKMDDQYLLTNHSTPQPDSIAEIINSNGHWTQIIMIIMMAVMIILSICHCFMFLRQSTLIRSMMRATCYYPKNRSVTMHNVEEPVNLIFLATIKLWGRSDEIVTTMGIQVCTLPSPYTQWVVKDRSYVKLVSSTTTVTRSHKNLITQFNWTHLCIQSTVMPNVDTCQDMPSSCVIPISDLNMSIDGGLPWNWRSVHQGNVIKVEVGRLGASKIIYNYQDDADGTMSTVPLLSDMHF